MEKNYTWKELTIKIYMTKLRWSSHQVLFSLVGVIITYICITFNENDISQIRCIIQSAVNKHFIGSFIRTFATHLLSQTEHIMYIKKQ